MIRRFSLALLTAVMAALALSACGSSDALEGKDAASVLKETFGPDHPVKSGRLDVGIKLDLKGLSGLSGPVTARLSGPFQSLGGKTLPAFDLNLSLNAGGQSFTAGAVSTGQKGFLSIAGQTYDIGDALYSSLNKGYKQAASTSKSKGSPSLSALGINPLGWLKAPRKVGEEDIGGAKTVHVTAPVDVAKLLTDIDKLLSKAGSLSVPGTGASVPTSITPAQRATIEQAVKTATFDVWAGKADGTLRRLRVAVSFAVPQSAQAKAGGLQSGDLQLDLTIGALNEKQTITAPKSAKPLSQLTSALQGMLGGVTGSSGSSGSSSSGSSSSGSQSKYLDCLQAAGSDLAKVQQCAAKIGK